MGNRKLGLLNLFPVIRRDFVEGKESNKKGGEVNSASMRKQGYVGKNNKIRIPNNWVPREDQMPLWLYLEGGGKRAIEIAHRRWG